MRPINSENGAEINLKFDLYSHANTLLGGQSHSVALMVLGNRISD